MSRRLLGLVTVLAAWAGTGSAAVITVDLNGTGQYTAIQPAIDAAEDGDTVFVKPGEYVITEPINFNRLHDPDDPLSAPVKNITLKSEGGAEVTTIRRAGPGEYSVLRFENGESDKSALEGLTLTDGTAIGVVCQNASPTLTNCTILGNYGGGVYCYASSSPTLTNV